MCEIAVIDPEQAPIQAVHQIAGRFHEEQGDGIGVLAVKNHGDEFSYNVHTSINPHWQTLYAFLKRNYDDTWRFVVHGRAATSGQVNRDTAHPIAVDCDHCDVEYVVHNGSVRKHGSIRSGLRSQGHTFNTEVDTEIIGHKVGEMPDSVADHNGTTYSFNGNLNYLVFSTDGILIRVEGKYHLTDDVTMTCSLSEFDDYESLGFDRSNDNEWMLIEPDGDSPSIETKERVVYTTQRQRGSSSSGSSSRNYRGSSGTGTGTRWGDQSEGTHTEQYTDYSEFEHITAIQVAPGIMKVIDDEAGEETYVRREVEPRLYFWYAPDPEPDNIDELEQLADARVEDGEAPGEQASLEDFPESAVTYAVVEEVSTVVAQEVDGVDVSDLAEIRDEIMHSAADGAQAAIEANAPA